MKTMEKTRPAEAASVAGQGIRSLMIHVEGSRESEPRLEVAARLARRLDATLLGVGAEMFQVYSDPYNAYGGELTAELQKVVLEDLARAEATFKRMTAGLQAEWQWTEAMPTPALARAARGADLIVAGGAPLGGPDTYRTIDTAELIMISGKPVLVAPPAPAPLRAEVVVVAWKDTRECRRAVADALPFLKAADEVVIAEVCEADRLDDARADTSDVLRMLSRHEVQARGKVITAPASRAAWELQDLAAAVGSDLLVAGGYGHSRLGEWVFGGVTHDLLHAPRQYVLFSH